MTVCNSPSIQACIQGTSAAVPSGEERVSTDARARTGGIIGAYVRNWLALACLGLLGSSACVENSANQGAAPPTYGASGAVTGAILAGVTVSLSGTATASTTTDEAGSYSFANLANGNYTLTASRNGYVFAPPSLAVEINNASVTQQDFIAFASAPPPDAFWDGCTSDACGPALRAPNYLCTDGTVGGPGPCKRGVDGQCTWSYRSCEAVTTCTGCALLGYPSTVCAAPQWGKSGPSGVCFVGPQGACQELSLQCFTP